MNIYVENYWINKADIFHTEEYNYLWQTSCMTDKKHMERCKFTIDKYNFNLIYGNIQSPYND